MLRHLLAVAALGPVALAAQTPVAAVSNTSGPLPIDRVVAIIGDQPLLWTDVLTAINQRRAQGLQVPTDSVQQAALARTVLNDLVDEEILVQKAKEMKLEVTESDIISSADRQIKSVRSQFKSDEEYRAELRNAGLGTAEEYRKALIEQYRRQNLQQKAFAELRKRAKPVNVTDEEVTAAFEKSRTDLQKRPASVTFRQIIVAPHASPAAKAKAKARADSLLVEIRKGGDFEQIAKRESMDPGTKALGGDLGWNRRGSGLVPQFEMMMFALRPGEVSPVIETAFGYHIIRVDRVQSAEVKARHILIAPVIDSADVENARVEADSVAAQWRRGVSYDSLLAKHHDPTEEKGVLQPFNRDSLPASYQAALTGAKAGTITSPFPLANPRGPSKFAVLQVVTLTDAGEYNAGEIREQIRAQLADERSIRQLLDEMRKHTYVSIRM
ncbi:MAG: peptidyl-prolyl cis-trans isomerase SurA [Gemmatimonadaceae bacterium]|jgi:peptidyl-prolyl cis-trans isomerase SurA|nr:peptidyl-prolyl cis-trans isomerase SurA [Gemmatimonadaceae bacterium]